MVVHNWSVLCTRGPHSMLLENSSCSSEKQRTLGDALSRHEIAFSCTYEWPTRKCSTHPTIITTKRPYVFFLFFLFFRNDRMLIIGCVQNLCCFDHFWLHSLTQHWAGSGEMAVIDFPWWNGHLFLKKYLRKHWTGSGENRKIICPQP